MKKQKLVALLLVAIMAVTTLSAVGVTTTQKVDAAAYRSTTRIYVRPNNMPHYPNGYYQIYGKVTDQFGRGIASAPVYTFVRVGTYNFMTREVMWSQWRLDSYARTASNGVFYTKWHKPGDYSTPMWIEYYSWFRGGAIGSHYYYASRSQTLQVLPLFN